jgi:phosphoribosylformylglycinamidine cyclo-ligase
MTTYKDSGVDIELGDAASQIAFKQAQSTFPLRQGLIGDPLADSQSFAGLLDFGKFYLTQCCDTVGTKIDLAASLGDFSTLGFDLLAMIADDAVCLGAEVVSITNTFETAKIKIAEIETMMQSLAKAAQEQKIVIAGGEIAEVGDKIKGTSWGGDAVGIVKKDHVIDSANLKVGSSVIALKEKGFRCNGFSLVRKILSNHFEVGSVKWRQLASKALEASIVYHRAILALHGDYQTSEPQVTLEAVAHITGGGIPGNLRRILKKNNLGARLEAIHEPPAIMQELQELGQVSDEEAYRAWNMGNGMLLVTPESQAKKAVTILKEQGINAQIAGTITKNPEIYIQNHGQSSSAKYLEFNA